MNKNICIFVCFITWISYGEYIRIDSLRLNVPLNQALALKNNWLNKFDRKTYNPTSDTSGIYLLVPFREGFFLRTISITEDSSLIEIKYQAPNSRKSMGKYRWPNITLTLKQECGLPVENVEKINPKSYFTYYGLTLINSGLSSFYCQYKNPVLKPLYFSSVVFFVGDGILTYAAFSKSDSKQLAAIGGLLLVKVY